MNVVLSNIQPDPLDPRDYIFPVDATAILPPDIDLRDHCDNIENQLKIGSCTANATVGAAEMFLKAQGRTLDSPAPDDADLSRLFNYYTSRELLGPAFLTGDPGSTLRMALRAANKLGIARESVWPYGDGSSEDVKPTDAAYSDAASFKLGAYYRITNPFTTTDQSKEFIFAAKFALASGYPVLVAMQVGNDIRTLKPGDVYGCINSSGTYGNYPIGFHAMLIVGYLTQPDGTTNFILRNSWGADWCDKGYFICSYRALFYDGQDFWVPMSFAGQNTVGPNATNTPPVKRCLSEAEVLQGYTDMMGVPPLSLDYPGPQWWLKEAPGATLRDMYYAGMDTCRKLLERP